MFPQLLAVVAIFLLHDAICDVVPGDRPRTRQLGPHHGLPRRRARREHLPDVRLLQHVPRRSTRPRRSTAPATRASSSRSSCAWSRRSSPSSACCRSSASPSEFVDRQRRAHRPGQPDPRRRALLRSWRSSGRENWSVFAAGAVIAARAGDGAVPLPAAVHRRRPHPGLGEGLGHDRAGHAAGSNGPGRARRGCCRTTTAPACTPRSRWRSATTARLRVRVPAGWGRAARVWLRSIQDGEPRYEPCTSVGRGGRLGLVGGAHDGHQSGGPVPLPAGGPGRARRSPTAGSRQRGRRTGGGRRGFRRGWSESCATGA